MHSNSYHKKRVLFFKMPIYMFDEIEAIAKTARSIKSDILSKSLESSFKNIQLASNIVSDFQRTVKLELLLSSPDFSKNSSVRIAEDVYEKLKISSALSGRTMAFEAVYRLADQGLCLEAVK